MPRRSSIARAGRWQTPGNRLGPGRDRRRRRRNNVEMRKLITDLAVRGVQPVDGRGRGPRSTRSSSRRTSSTSCNLTVAPVFVGDSESPRFVHDGHLPLEPRPSRGNSSTFRSSATFVLLRYALFVTVRGVRARQRMFDATADCDDPDPGRAAPAVSRTDYAADARVFSFDGLVDDREHLAFALGDGHRLPSRERNSASR